MSADDLSNARKHKRTWPRWLAPTLTALMAVLSMSVPAGDLRQTPWAIVDWLAWVPTATVGPLAFAIAWLQNNPPPENTMWKKWWDRLRPAAIGTIIFLFAFVFGTWTSLDPRSLAGWIEKTDARGVSLVDYGDEPIDGEGDPPPITIRIGSKDFAEQRILGYMTEVILEQAGANAIRIPEAGSEKIREMLLDGDIDAYWEYTGTAWTQHLDRTSTEWFERPAEQRDDVDLFREVRDADREALDDDGQVHDITWFAMGSANNAYVVVANKAAVNDNDLDRDSHVFDYAVMAKTKSGNASRLCITEEFENRKNDGLEHLLTYLGLPQDHPVEALEADLVPRAVVAGDRCQFGVLFRNAPQINWNDDPSEIDPSELLPLDDDFWPPYNIAMAMRTDVYRTHSAAYVTLFNTISTVLNDENMRALNETAEEKVAAASDVTEKEEAARKVAEDFLREHEII